MAIIKPIKEKRKYNDVKENESLELSAEKKVCEFIEEFISDDVFDDTVRGIINKPISGREPDIVLIIPNYGILIIEIKRFRRENIEMYTDDGEILIKNGNISKHPFEQAKEYIYTIMNRLRKKYKKFIKENKICCVVPIVAMPNMSRDEYMELGLDMPYDIEGTITSEWMVNGETFKEKFKEAIEFAFGRVNGSKFDLEYYNKAVGMIWPEWRANSIKSENKEKTSTFSVQGEKCTSQMKEEKAVKSKLTSDEILNELNKAKNSMVNIEKSINIWDYSRIYLLHYLMTEEEILKVINLVIEERNEGTKIIIHCIDLNDEKKFLIKEILEKNLNDDFANEDIKNLNVLNENSWSTFLFEIFFLDGDKIELEGVNIKTAIKNLLKYYKKSDLIKFSLFSTNGKEIVIFNNAFENDIELTESEANYIKLLRAFGKYTMYNHEQFIVEHSEIDKDILVTAGAGTGKTFSMVGRIAFITHFNIINNQEDIKISEIVYMMTFTNNSTNEMRKRIAKYFEKYYKLTNKDCYLNILEQIENMKIKTIDSMAKFVLMKYSHIMGLTKDFSIKSGKFIKNNIIKRNVQDQLNKSELNRFISRKSLKSYEIEETVNKIIEYISNRSISLDDNNKLADQENGENEYRNYLENVISDSINEYHEYCIKNNSLEMENIALWLKDYKNMIKIEEEKVNDDKIAFSGIRYLFIDEFQDTDKNQIELIAFFSDLYRLKLFVVGDRKQSIYGFRGAQDTAFNGLEKLSGRDFKMLYLAKNYRTDSGLLMNFNEIFQENFKGENFNYVSKDVLIPQKILVSNKNSVDDIYKMTKLTSDSSNLYELKNILCKYIDTLKNRIKSEPTENKHIIAILTRTNNEIDIIKKINSEYELGIKFEAEESFYQQDAVIDLYKLVCALLNSSNPQYSYNLSLTPYCTTHIPRGNFYYEENDRIITLKDMDKFQENFKFSVYYEKIRTDSGLKLLRELVNDNRPWERYVPEGDDTIDIEIEKLSYLRNEYRKCLDQLFQVLIERNGADYITLNQIKNNLDICIKTNQSMEMYKDIKNKSNGLDTIEILCTTVHKSKGLEYRSVILPFTTSNIGKISGMNVLLEENNKLEYCLRKKDYEMEYAEKYYKSMNFSNVLRKKEMDQIAEELRILYVAMTRAKCEFYFIVNVNEEVKLLNNSRRNSTCWSKYLKK